MTFPTNSRHSSRPDSAPVRVSLRKVYTLRTEGPRSRIGCAFVS